MSTNLRVDFIRAATPAADTWTQRQAGLVWAMHLLRHAIDPQQLQIMVRLTRDWAGTPAQLWDTAAAAD